MAQRGAAVIDVGINRVDGKLVGDVDYEGALERAACVTPVPGGSNDGSHAFKEYGGCRRAKRLNKARNTLSGVIQMTELKRTALYDVHAARGARFVPFAGYEMPVQYEGVMAEHSSA